MNRVITWSFGGGVQSVAIAVAVKRRMLPRPERCVIADTSREASSTWKYTDDYVRPLLQSVGIEVEIAPHSLATVDMYGHNGDLLMPVFTQTGKLPTLCSNEWKQRVVRRYLRSAGFGPEMPVITWLGISVDEIGRAKPSDVEWQEYTWPLAWDLRMRASHCIALIADEGLPIPRKSSCWCCPHRQNEQWRELEPADFAAACDLDDELRANDKQGGVFLHRSGVPLREADLSEDPPSTLSLFGGIAACDSGFCWT